jgi:antitoxin ParD1/3/4
MKLRLPHALAAFVEKQTACGEYNCPSEYIRELIRREHDCDQIRQRLYAGSESPRRSVADDEYFEGLRAH